MVDVFSADLTAQTAECGRTEAEAHHTNDRIRTLQNEVKSLAGQARTLLDDLRKLEIDRDLQTERVRQAQAAVA